MIRTFLIIIACFPMLVAAATDNFRVYTLIGSDTEAPSTPSITSALPVSPHQIDIAWSGSTDNTIVSGYRVYRDGVAIATTSQTQFSDTGLAPSTTYAYVVDAFDIFDNISSTSPSVATTTLGLPPTPPPSPGATSSQNGTESTAGPRLVGELDIIAEQTTAMLSWRTNMYAKFYVRWGRTENYELGLIASGVLKTAHQTTLYNLEPGTRYYYEIVGETAYGFTTTVADGSFQTSRSLHAAMPPNVSLLEADVTDNTVLLSWQNPVVPFAYVRILRNHIYFPLHAADGQVVYQGTGSSFTDTEALAQFSPQYYTIFVYDAAGNVSSGAVIKVDKPGSNPSSGSSAVDPVPSPSSTVPNSQASSSVPAVLEPVGDDAVLSADEVYLEQGAALVTFAERIVLDAELPVMIWIPKTAVPPHLKSIIFTWHDVTDTTRTTSVLLKLSPDETRYQAVVPPMGRAGTARGTIEVFDYEAGLVRRIGTTFTFVSDASLPVIWPDMFVRYWFLAALVVALAALVSWLIAWWRHRVR